MTIRILKESQDKSIFQIDKNDFTTMSAVYNNVEDDPEDMEYYQKIQDILGIKDPKNIAIIHDDNAIDFDEYHDTLKKFNKVKTVSMGYGDISVIAYKGVKAVMAYAEGGITSVFIDKRYVSAM